MYVSFKNWKPVIPSTRVSAYEHGAEVLKCIVQEKNVHLSSFKVDLRKHKF